MRRLVPLLLALALSACFRAHPPTPRPTFAALADALFDSVEAEGTLVGALVIDARTESLLYARREHARLLPASTMKVVSTAAALSALGPDFRFRTPVWLEGTQLGAVFEGDLVVEASGDPSLGSWRFPETSGVCAQVADALIARGVQRWRGGLRVEGAGGPGVSLGPGWAWDDAAYAYSAPPTRFVFRENTAELRLERFGGASCGAPVSVALVPSAGETEAVVSLETTAARAGLGCVREWGADRLRCVWRSTSPEQCPRSTSTRIAVHEPQKPFAMCVEQALAARGVTRDFAIAIALEPTVQAPIPARELLVEIVSPTLAELVRVTNKESLNLYAERLALRFAQERTGEESYRALAEAMAQELERRGIARNDLSVADGSGLSRYNLATARGMVRLLKTSLDEPYGRALIESLPIAGVDGTLTRSPVTSAAGLVYAKTGTLSGQKAFVGIADRPGDAAHPRVLFALLLGNQSSEPALHANEVFARFADALVVATVERRGSSVESVGSEGR
ncbi:MAG: D-alanyl-D-alanine carboxypeptidase/D-alanyl-D-alanine endopeptidase [Myxococcales bacterium]|jgi:D-alanyl-D-alanine carboxypeptidase/D-alanyl-D-alanine-endopeptidase (penicillin-binding protein 4)